LQKRKGITKAYGGTRWKLEAERESFSFPGAFKTPMGREEPGDTYPLIIDEWGGAWVVPGPGEGALSCPHSQDMNRLHIFAIEKKAQRRRRFSLKYNIKSYIF
jgi:hypothetical protein